MESIKINEHQLDYCNVCETRIKKGYYKNHKKTNKHKKEIVALMTKSVEIVCEDLEERFSEDVLNTFFKFIRQRPVDDFDYTSITPSMVDHFKNLKSPHPPIHHHQECDHCRDSGTMYLSDDCYGPCIFCKFGDKA